MDRKTCAGAARPAHHAVVWNDLISLAFPGWCHLITFHRSQQIRSDLLHKARAFIQEV
jgi:hypothetical protein